MDLVLRIEPASRQLHFVRRVIAVWVDSVGLADDRVQLISTELLTNAFAVTPRGARVELELRRAPGTVEVTVSDRGPGLDLDSVGQVTSTQPRGRGLLIVRELADQVLLRREAGATSVTAAIAVGGNAAGTE